MNKTSGLQKTVLIAFGMLACIIALELGMRASQFVLLSIQDYRNARAIREKGACRILCIGESTTAFEEGGQNCYPSQLDDILNKYGAGIKFSVINTGKPGIRTPYILTQLENDLERYDPDIIVAMIGINDAYLMPYRKKAVDTKLEAFLKSFKLYRLLSILKTSMVPRAKTASFRHPKEAIDDIAGVAEAGKKEYSDYMKAAWSHLGKGTVEEAIKMAEKAIEVDPGNVNAYFWLSQTYANYLPTEHAKMAELYEKIGELKPDENRAIAFLACYYDINGNEQLARKYAEKIRLLNRDFFIPAFWHNYRRIKDIADKKNIKLVCVQYPMRSITQLRSVFETHDNIIFVDNEQIFKTAVKKEGYFEYFIDNFGGDFGHCTEKGNRLLAQNIADAILKECFRKAASGTTL